MQYKLAKNPDGSDNLRVILGLADDGNTLSIPNDPNNTDWQAYQAWLEADPENQPLPADEE